MEMPNEFSLQDAMNLAASPAGQQLIAFLRSRNSDAFQKAMTDAASGNYSGAKEVIEKLMADPQAQKLLKDLGR